LSSVVAWFSFFDIGFGHGLRNKFAAALAKGDIIKARIYVSTTYAATGTLIILVWCSFAFINQYINWARILNTSISPFYSLNQVAFLVFSFFSIQFVLKLVGTVLQANQESAKASLFDLLINLFTAAIIFIMMHLGRKGNILDLALITGIIQVLVLSISSLIFFHKNLHPYRPSFRLVRIEYVKDLMGIGIKFFIIQVSAVFIFETTNLVITQILGPENVTIYNVAFRYFSIATMLCGIIASPFWSAFTEAYVKKDFLWMKKIVKQLNQFWFFILILIICLLLSSQFLYGLWIGKSIKITWTVSILMAINMMLVTRFNIFVLLINATGKIYLQLITNVILGVLFIPFSIIMCKNFGLAGIVAANLSINAVYALLIPIQNSKILDQRAKGIWNR
jgi:O-antigen/teichoic acid export membrane protein